MDNELNNYFYQSSKIESTSLTILLEPTSACNLDCSYCYKGRKQPKFMSVEILKSILSKIITHNNNNGLFSSFVWHGGEPTLLGIKFYESAFKISNGLEDKYPISHTVQTNGTLLTDELLDLFSQNNVSISVSLDGPKKYHDKLRPMKNNNSSYDKIIDGLQRAKAKKIDVGILMSITNDNLVYVKEIFEYCRSNKFTFGINPITSDLHSQHTTEVTPDNYLQICLELFDLWFYQKDYSIQVNPGFGISRLILSQNRLSDCSNCENCQNHFLSIGPEGDVYPCNRFYGVEEYKLGNLLKEEIISILSNSKRQYLLSRTATKIKKCLNCSIAQYCNGGCMHHALVHNGSLYSSDHLCEVYRGLIDHAINRLHSELIQ